MIDAKEPGGVLHCVDCGFCLCVKEIQCHYICQNENEGGGAGVTVRLFSKEFIFSYLLSLVNSVKTVSEGTTQQFLLSSL